MKVVSILCGKPKLLEKVVGSAEKGHAAGTLRVDQLSRRLNSSPSAKDSSMSSRHVLLEPLNGG